MIYYSPTNSDVLQKWITYRPRTCFIMTQLGGKRSHVLNKIISDLKNQLKKVDLKFVDANSLVTGKDFLYKIWDITLSVPFGVAVVTETMKSNPLFNIFYEVGIMTALGKEIIIVKSKGFKIPSDLIRTEYIEYDEKFDDKIKKFLNQLNEQADYYSTMAENLKSKPLLALDYFRRSYLITGDESVKELAAEIVKKENFDEHTKMMINSFLKSK